MMAGGHGTKVFDDEDVDHYAVLGLPFGEEGAKLTLKEIEKAYREQSRIRHPDKRHDDPNATADFQHLKTSFEVLKDEVVRRIFDARLRAQRERVIRDSFMDTKWRKLTTNLEEWERASTAAEASDPAKQEERWEKDVAARVQEELAQFQARKAKKFATAPTSNSKSSEQEKNEENGGTATDKERMLKIQGAPVYLQLQDQINMLEYMTCASISGMDLQIAAIPLTISVPSISLTIIMSGLLAWHSQIRVSCWPYNVEFIYLFSKDQGLGPNKEREFPKSSINADAGDGSTSTSPPSPLGED
ncbi:hypothetical protein Cni_G01888 [Canna indica]|uniref:J domain-containing protein n=1 Tax=Canna indica TaxID=4628 RepID=A0AAQ3JQC1_9LILI|nr:hypothetical protein Cni_G01888 [Canna indica]